MPVVFFYMGEAKRLGPYGVAQANAAGAKAKG